MPDPDTRSRPGRGDVVLGVDPGLTRCGIGVVAGPPAQPHHLDHGCLRTAPDLPLEDRLLALHAGVTDAIERHTPVLVAVERVLFSRNVRTAMTTGHAAGVVMLAAAQAGLPVVQLTPTDVKASVAGDGAADKDGVARMVVAQLGLDRAPRPADAADALAVALAALVRMRTAAASTAGATSVASRPPATTWEGLVAERGLRVVGGTSGTTRVGPR